MGMIENLAGLVFGNGRNVVVETAELFRENTEKGAVRDAAHVDAVLKQFAAEFAMPKASLFDRIIDGLNRVPRPAMALGTLGLFVAAMSDPVWFAERMQGVALVPEPLWWLMGAIVSFYFGARHQSKTQDFQRSLAETLARTRQVTDGLAALRSLDAGLSVAEPAVAGPAAEAPNQAPPAEEAPEERSAREDTGDNAALSAWRRSDG